MPQEKKRNNNSTTLLYNCTLYFKYNDNIDVIILYITVVCLTGYYHSYSIGKTSLLV
jgi:hypothetical protein